MRIDTRLARAGLCSDPATGAISAPIHPSATFAHPGLGTTTGYDYSRTGNPTRSVLEEVLADLEGGVAGFCLASGMAALTCFFLLFRPGDHFVVSDDLYGGTYRALEQVFARLGLEISYADLTRLEAARAALTPRTRALLVETPTNPLMKIADIQALSAQAGSEGPLLAVDNTFLTPYYQGPLELGANLVLHSATKFLGGHNDLLAGVVVTRRAPLPSASPSCKTRQGRSSRRRTRGSSSGPSRRWLSGSIVRATPQGESPRPFAPTRGA